MSHKAAVWTAGFLGVTATAVVMELVAALDHDPDTVPWTILITNWIPAPITAAAIGILLAWLPGHFASSYLSRKGVVMIHAAPDDPAVLATDPKPPREPLLTVATITGLGTAVAAALVAFGVPLTDTQQGALLAVLAVLAPVIVGFAARRTVYSPATVAKLLTPPPAPEEKPWPPSSSPA